MTEKSERMMRDRRILEKTKRGEKNFEITFTWKREEKGNKKI